MFRRTFLSLAGLNKVTTAAEALSGLTDGMTIAVGGFGCAGMPHYLVQEVQKKGTKNHHCFSDSAGVDEFGLGLLLNTHQADRMTVSYVGNNHNFAKQYLAGDVEIEFCPQGTLAERMRAGGAGIPAFFTATGYGTQRQTGGQILRYNKDGTPAKLSAPRETRSFNGRWYVLEETIRTDFSLVKARKADRCGNLVFNGLAANFNLACAMCGHCVVVEADEVVENGELSPAEIHVPGVFVHHVVPCEKYPVYIEKRTVRKHAHEEEKTATKAPSKADQERQLIARRAALEFHDGMYVNLGIGIPTESSNYIPDGVTVTLQSENGLLGMGPFPTEEEIDPEWINAGKQTITALPGASVFDSSMSFSMIRGGHMNMTMLGALEVDVNGDLANWMIPGKLVKGPGGAMDLVASGSSVIVTMTHTTKNGEPKILEACRLPVTGKSCVTRIITEKAVFDVNKDGVHGLTLVEIADGVTVEDLKKCTGAPFRVSDTLKPVDYAPDLEE